MATASIGSTPDSTFFPINSPTNFFTNGILVGPPTITILVISDLLILESSKAFSIEGLQRSMIGPINSSSLALVILNSRFLAPEEGSCAMKGRLRSVSITVESSIFAFSAASLTLAIAVLSCERSKPSFFLNSSRT